jgi:hypothetical protein
MPTDLGPQATGGPRDPSRHLLTRRSAPGAGWWSAPGPVRHSGGNDARCLWDQDVRRLSYDTRLLALRDARDQNDFDAARAESAALSTEEAIAYAQRAAANAKDKPGAGPHSRWRMCDAYPGPPTNTSRLWFVSNAIACWIRGAGSISCNFSRSPLAHCQVSACTVPSKRRGRTAPT